MMATRKWFDRTFVVGLVAVGSVCTPKDVTASGEDVGGKFVLDFSGSPNRGVSVGKFNNVAFKLDLQKPVRKLSVPSGNQRLPDLVATFDYADCTKGQEPLLEQPLRDLSPGDAAWVEYVDVTLIPISQHGLNWTGGVCYGFREPGGRWHWNLTTTPLTYDSATDRVVARISVGRGPIDALKLVFEHAVPPQALSSVTVTTRPIGSRPDPPFTPQTK